MTDSKYNGWTNYETWAAALWMGNDEGSSRYWDDMARQALEDSETKEEAKLSLMRQLKDEHEDGAPDLGSSLWADLLGAAMSEVNWHEIASHLIDDIAD